MAEEAAPTTPPQAEQVVLTPPAAESPADDKKEDASAAVVDEGKEEPQPALPVDPTDEKVAAAAESASFKEEITKVADLAENENKALQQLKSLIQQALNNHDFSATPPKAEEKTEQPVVQENKEPEQPTKADEEGDKKKEEAATEVKKTEEVVVEEKTEKGVVVAEKTEEVVLVAEKTEKEVVVAEKTEEVVVVAEKTEEVVVVAEKTEKEVVVAEKTEEVVVVAEKTEEVVVVEEKTTAAPSVDDDGAKTVEAIEETVVAVSVPTEEPAKEAPEPEELAPKAEEASPQSLLPPDEVSIYGVPLLLDDRSDVILLKFLRARDFKAKDAFTMIKNTIRWRKEFRIDELIEEDLGLQELEKAVYMDGFDKEGHPVCYNVYGEFSDKEVYKKAFADEEKRQRFLRWRIQFLERSIRKLDFAPGEISTIVQVNDLKNSPGPGKWELRQATKQALQLLQDNYPEFVAKQVFINVPWWYLAVNRMISPFLTQRTKSKFVFAGPSKSAETLLRYIAAEQLPVKYGGLSKDGEFGNTDAVTEITVRPAAKHTVEFPVTENCLVSWEVRVIGWDVSYGAEFVPSSEGSYTVIIQKARKVASSSEEQVLSNTYKIGEPGKVVITIDNQSSKKKKLLYRLKTNPNNSSTTD